jgi:hypothetical protein
LKSKFAAVLTTINHPNEAMSILLENAQSVGAAVIVVGDTKTPTSWSNTSFEYLDIPKQKSLFGDISDAIPTKHYARKNLGYLMAHERRVEWIYETDDDNIPISSPFNEIALECEVETFNTDTRWMNVYEIFGYESVGAKPSLIWPRGFDLNSLHKTAFPAAKLKVISPIQQGLANGDPDVDAIYRLVLGNFVNFNNVGPVGLQKGQICPTNSQTTWWHSSAHQLMYLPSTCTFRLTDILRGFVAWRILQERGETVSFHSPKVRQDRNEHDLLRDFRDEVQLFIQSDQIISELLALNLNDQTVAQQLVSCYKLLVDLGVVTVNEIQILEKWNAFFG